MGAGPGEKGKRRGRGSSRFGVVLAALGLAGLASIGTAQEGVEKAIAGGLVVLLDIEETASLAGPWKFRPGDDFAWAAATLDDRDWREISVPTGFVRRDAVTEIAWYRRHVQVGPGDRELSLVERAALNLGVTIGKVNSAYEIFAGGRKLGGVGALPPEPRMDYDRHRTYAVPPEAIGPSGRLVIALRVWKSPQTRGTLGSPHEGPFVVGALAELTRLELTSELPALFLAILFLVTGAFHLELYRRRPVQQGYLWFAATSFGFAGYTFLRTQWKYAWTDNFLLLKEVEYLLIFVQVALFTQLLWTLLGVPVGRLLRAYQWICIGTGVVIAATPGLFLNVRVLPFWQLSLLLVVGYGLWVIVRESWRKNPEAHLIAVGAIVTAAFFLNDVAVDRGFITGPRLTPYGFAFFLLSLAMSLANQFRRTHEELEVLRRDLEKRVEARTRELVVANRAKSRFLARMSHEMRTPIHGVMGMAELLASSALPPAQQQQIDIIGRSADKLRRLVDDLLDFASLDAGKMVLEETDFALRREVRQVVDLLRPRAAGKDLGLELAVAPEVPDDLHGDPSRLCQALFNLIDNAIKFTREGSVAVRVTADGDRVRFEISDSGIGIPSVDRERVFRPFTQLDDSTRREFGGSGLGLAITQGLVDLMGGELGIDGDAGGGSTFWLTIPLQQAHRPAARARVTWRPDARQIAVRDLTPRAPAAPILRDGEGATQDLEAEEAALDDTADLLDRPLAGEAEVESDAPRVLVVDDLESNRTTMLDVLKSLGYRGEAVAGGLAALAALDARDYELVLMDCQMPELDGYETTRRIRRKEAEASSERMPVVAFTAYGGEWEREKCLAAGMDDYLAIPFHSRELAAVLDRWLPIPGEPVGE